MLAYLFWHRPKAGVDSAAYEQAQRSFHDAIEVESACFRIDRLPFIEGGGYEDWYLISNWAALGELNAAAVDTTRGTLHKRAASLAAVGWGALYGLVRGPATIPVQIEWLDKPRGENADEFVAALSHEGVWRRQLVLGPAPEFCVTLGPDSGSKTTRRRLTR